MEIKMARNESCATKRGLIKPYQAYNKRQTLHFHRKFQPLNLIIISGKKL
jgi:hypothetical protein